jgi:glycosyltransferase involved in cell wall biosynthesis
MNIAIFGWYHHRNAGDDRIQQCLTRWLDGHTLAFLPAGRQPPVHLLRTCDAAIVGGGGILQREGGMFRGMARWVRRAGIPVALAGVSVEAITPGLRQELRGFLDVCCFAWFRDRGSLEAVGEHPRAFVAPDVTWLYPFEPAPEEGSGIAVSAGPGSLQPRDAWRAALMALGEPLHPWPLYFENDGDGRALRELIPDAVLPGEFDLDPARRAAAVLAGRFHALLCAQGPAIPGRQRPPELARGRARLPAPARDAGTGAPAPFPASRRGLGEDRFRAGAPAGRGLPAAAAGAPPRQPPAISARSRLLVLMHVGFLTTEYPPLPAGGIGTSVRNLARALVAHGHRATVVGWGREAEFDDAGVRVRFLEESRVPRMGWLLNRAAARRELARLVEEEELDVVEAPDWCGLSAGIDLPCPLAIRCNGSSTYFAEILGERARRRVTLAERLALERADGLAAVSRFTADRTRFLFGLPDRFEIIPNSVDTARFVPGRPAEVEPARILYLGTLVRKKGVLDLGPVFSEVVRREPRARLELVGRDALDGRTGSRSTREILAASLSPQARARTDFVGPLPYDSVQERVRPAAVCVFPSYAEAQPLAWLEAMACGRPIVGYDFGWAREVVRSGLDGILVPPGDLRALADVLVALLDDPELAAGMGASARLRVEAGFDAGVVALRCLAWYSSLKGKRGRG